MTTTIVENRMDTMDKFTRDYLLALLALLPILVALVLYILWLDAPCELAGAMTWSGSVCVL